MGKNNWPPVPGPPPGSTPARRRCYHPGSEAVAVGPYTIWATGSQYWPLKPEPFPGEANCFVTLNGSMPFRMTGKQEVLTQLELPDFGGVPPDWQLLLEALVIPRLEAGQRLVAFCTASHGRTGTFLASLVALLEGAAETPDPIVAIRERHCHHAVETHAQAKGIYALRGQSVPSQYESLL